MAREGVFGRAETGLEAIVLAGGSGARFGGGKLTHPWRGGALIDGALAAAFAAPARMVTVVTGADPLVESAARGFAKRIGEAARLRVVHCESHAEGMGATLRFAIASLPPDASGAYVFLGDMPAIPPAILPALAAALAAGAPAAAPSYQNQRGHPVLFSATLFPQLTMLTGDQGARDVLRAIGQGLALVDSDDAGVVLDIDRPEQLER